METYGNMTKEQKATTSCAICMNDYDHDSLVCELNCQSGHIFHYECLNNWFKFRSSPAQMAENPGTNVFKCPTCRAVVKH